MHTRRLQVRGTVLLLLTSILAVVWIFPLFGGENDYLFKVHFLDVGQGDAILLESPSGQQMLIDGGRNSVVVNKLSAQMGFFDKNIEYVLATHLDSDHVGGLVEVFKRYKINTFIGTDATGDTAIAETLDRVIKEEKLQIIEARRGEVVDLGSGVKVEILWPEVSVKEMESNAGSIVAKVTYGDASFLLTGDAPKRIEEYLVLVYGEYLHSTVLKVGHHGSRTSTAELFLTEVDPLYAVISAGANNSYGHPHVEVTDMLFNYGIVMVSTAEEGTVTFVSDGSRVWRE